MTCFICRDEVNKLFKICVCQDSMVCEDCFSLTNQNINDPENYQENRLKCPVCRRYFEFQYINNMKYLKNITFFLGIKFICLLSEIAPLIWVYQLPNQEYPNNLYTTKNHFFLNSLIQVIFLKGGIKYYLMQNLKNLNEMEKIKWNLNIDYIYIFISNIFFLVLTLLKDYKTSESYTMMILLPFYYIPFFVIIMIYFTLNFNQNMIFYKRRYREKKVKINQILNLRLPDQTV